MLGFLKRLFFGRDLSEVLSQTKKLVIQGVRFEIKKIDPLDHAKGLHVLRSQFDLYSLTKPKEHEVSEADLKKIRQHYRDVFLAGVIRPALSIKPESGEAIFVDDIFKDEMMSEKLYFEIICFTYGKKKFKSSVLRALKS